MVEKRCPLTDAELDELLAKSDAELGAWLERNTDTRAGLELIYRWYEDRTGLPAPREL